MCKSLLDSPSRPQLYVSHHYSRGVLTGGICYDREEFTLRLLAVLCWESESHGVSGAPECSTLRDGSQLPCAVGSS